jgi:hypothetical protein
MADFVKSLLGAQQPLKAPAAGDDGTPAPPSTPAHAY